MPNPYDANLSKWQQYPVPAAGRGPGGFVPPKLPSAADLGMAPPGAIEGWDTLPVVPAAPKPAMAAPAAPRPVPTWVPGPPAGDPNGNDTLFRSGFDAGAQPSAGSMTSSKPAMSPEAAVAGLRGMDYPELARLRNAADISSSSLRGGFGGGTAGIGLGDRITADVMGGPQMVQQRAQTDLASKALAAQHPAVAGLAERSALQKAYPQQIEGQYRLRTEMEDSAGNLEVAGINAHGDVDKNQAAILDYAMRGLTEIDSQLTQPNLTDDELMRLAERRAYWQGILKNVSRERMGGRGPGIIPQQ